MRNVALSVIRGQVKAETRRALGVSETAQDGEMNQIIFDVQQWLGGEFDWPFLRSRWDVMYASGNRYLAFPTTDDVSLAAAINFERPVSLFVKWNGVWQPVEYGIREIEELNYLDSDLGQQSDPVQRWMFDDEANFEIWPLPATSGTLRFTGQRQLTEIRSQISPVIWNDNATLDLDDQLITYYAAAEYLLGDGREAGQAAQTMLGRAQDRMRQIRATYPKRDVPPCIIAGRTKFDRKFLRTVPMIVVAGSNPH